MTRWVIDVTEIDVEVDLQRHDRMKLHVGTPFGRKETWKPTGNAMTRTDALDSAGAVVTLTMKELIEQQRRRREEALSENLLGQVCSGLSQPKNDAEISKGVEVRVFSTFTNAQGKRTVCTVQPRQTLFRGVDVVNAFLQQIVVPDDRLSARFSTNPRLYKLYIADEFTGEEEMVLQLDGAAQNFACFAIQPLPAAKLFLFPQRTQLLPSVSEDINLTVEVRSLDSQVKTIKRHVLVPADMLAESLEQAVVNRIPGIGVVQGSLRIKYGPVELNINECYNFGTGCGQMDVPIAERTILSLFRFGVTDVLVQRRVPDENTDVCAPVEDIVIDIDAEEAQTFQQFEVMRINRYGARQQRVLCVDGERLYMTRPNADGSGVSKVNGEKLIREIEEIHTSPTKPSYLKICYSRASNHEDDCIECNTVYNRALLHEKLRIQLEMQKKKDEEQQKGDSGTLFSRVLHILKLRAKKS